jgi:hypothetical protein
MKLAISLLLLCTSVHAASTESSIAPLELTEGDAIPPSVRPVRETLALAVIQSRLEERAAKLGDVFPTGHVRHTLGKAIATQFNSAIEAYRAADSSEAANLALKDLGIFCIEQELKLFKLQNTRYITVAGNETYDYDVITLRNILDFVQTEGAALEERVLLSALKVVGDRLEPRSFIENLAAINIDEIFPLMSDHALVAFGDVSRENVAQLIAKLRALPSY